MVATNYSALSDLEKSSDRPEPALLQLQHQRDDALAPGRSRDLRVQRVWTLQKTPQGALQQKSPFVFLF